MTFKLLIYVSQLKRKSTEYFLNGGIYYLAEILRTFFLSRREILNQFYVFDQCDILKKRKRNFIEYRELINSAYASYNF